MRTQRQVYGPMNVFEARFQLYSRSLARFLVAQAKRTREMAEMSCDYSMVTKPLPRAATIHIGLLIATEESPRTS